MAQTFIKFSDVNCLKLRAATATGAMKISNVIFLDFLIFYIRTSDDAA